MRPLFHYIIDYVQQQMTRLRHDSPLQMKPNEFTNLQIYQRMIDAN